MAEVMAFAVPSALPAPSEVEAGKAVAEQVRVASNVPLSAVRVVASGAPVLISMVEVEVSFAKIASSAAFAARIDMTGVAAMRGPSLVKRERMLPRSEEHTSE